MPPLEHHVVEHSKYQILENTQVANPFPIIDEEFLARTAVVRTAVICIARAFSVASLLKRVDMEMLPVK